MVESSSKHVQFWVAQGRRQELSWRSCLKLRHLALPAGNWPPSLIGNGELVYFAQFCPAKRQRKAVNYFLGFDKEPQRHKMPFTKYSISIN